MKTPFKTTGVAMPVIFALSACGGGGTSSELAGNRTLATTAAEAVVAPPAQEELRPHDARSFVVQEASLPFGPMAGVAAETDRWFGIRNGSGYRIEVPRNWNGKLVMYAHGYEGSTNTLDVSDPTIRRHLIENGYAWAASSFSRNNYDVRAGIEDTNALASAFTEIAALNNRPLPAPSRTYIVGGSMGGHIAAAAVERETIETAINKFRYHGAVPMCAVLGDTELFDYLNAYHLLAQYLAGVPATSFPVLDFAAKRKKITDKLWHVFPLLPDDGGRKLRSAVKQLTGGERPMFEYSFRLKPLQDPVWDRFGNDGTVEGILNKNVTDTTRIVYQLDDHPALSPEEQALNANILRITGAPDANPLRSTGLRWVPKVNGAFGVPVVTLHTLGDLFVPFNMQQTYKRRAIEHGSDQWLVQRAIRSPGHCDLTIAEQVAAFEAMVNWEQHGVKPAGDDVLTPSVVADSRYGCGFTNDATGPDDSRTLETVRKLVPSC